MTFGGCSRLGKTGSHTATVEASSCVISEEAGECRLSRNSRQRQKKIKQQASQISSLEAQNKKLGQLLEPKFLVETITQAVASSLKMGKTTNPDSSPSGFISKPYLGIPCPSQLAPGVDGSLDPSLTCRYCKDTRHLKENCVKLTQCLAWNKQKPMSGGTSKPGSDTTKTLATKKGKLKSSSAKDQAVGAKENGPHEFTYEEELIWSIQNASILAMTKLEIMQCAVAKET